MHANRILALAATLVFASACHADAAPREIIHSISGHGTWALDTGDDYQNHQPYIESTAINATLDADGSVDGTIVWMDTYNGLFENHGESFSGYTWQVDIDTFIMLSEHEVYVEGTIFHSNVESDIGVRSGFYIRVLSVSQCDAGGVGLVA